LKLCQIINLCQSEYKLIAKGFLQLNSEFVVGDWRCKVNPWEFYLLHGKIDPIMEAFLPVFIMRAIICVDDERLSSFLEGISHDLLIEKCR